MGELALSAHSPRFALMLILSYEQYFACLLGDVCGPKVLASLAWREPEN